MELRLRMVCEISAAGNCGAQCGDIPLGLFLAYFGSYASLASGSILPGVHNGIPGLPTGRF